MNRLRRTPRLRGVLAMIVVALGVATVPALAGANDPPPGPATIGLEIKAVDAQARKVSAVLHCVGPDKAGKLVTLVAGPEVEIGALQVGQMVGAVIDPSTSPPTITQIVEPPCDAKPGATSGPGDGPAPCGPKPSGDARIATDDGPRVGCADAPDFKRGFLSRVWKFVGEVDGYEDGKLSITVGKILNLPKRFKTQDDELVDEDAIVLLGKARVYDKNRHRVSRDKLEDAEEVRIHGKLLAPSKWQEDEDGTPVTTIRAKKIIILG